LLGAGCGPGEFFFERIRNASRVRAHSSRGAVVRLVTPAAGDDGWTPFRSGDGGWAQRQRLVGGGPARAHVGLRLVGTPRKPVAQACRADSHALTQRTDGTYERCHVSGIHQHRHRVVESVHVSNHCGGRAAPSKPDLDCVAALQVGTQQFTGRGRKRSTLRSSFLRKKRCGIPQSQSKSVSISLRDDNRRFLEHV